MKITTRNIAIFSILTAGLIVCDLVALILYSKNTFTVILDFLSYVYDAVVFARLLLYQKWYNEGNFSAGKVRIRAIEECIVLILMPLTVFAWIEIIFQETALFFAGVSAGVLHLVHLLFCLRQHWMLFRFELEIIRARNQTPGAHTQFYNIAGGKYCQIYTLKDIDLVTAGFARLIRHARNVLS